MTELDIHRGSLVVIVVPGPSGSAQETAAALKSAQIETCDVRVMIADQGVGADAKNRAATIDKVDYLAFVDAGTPLPSDHLASCVALLRSDLSTALVGWSAAGRPRGDLDMFVVGRACVLRHSAFHAIGGFDASHGPVLEDLDLGWRLWVAGWRVRSCGPAPTGLIPSVPPEVGPRVRRMLAGVLDKASLDEGWDDPEGRAIIQEVSGRRFLIQDIRQRGDGLIIPMAHAAVHAWARSEPSAQPVRDALGRWGAPSRAGDRRRIAVVTSDTLAPRMAGPAIRAVQIAKRLAREHDVILATTGPCELVIDGLEVRQVGERGLKELEAWCDVFIFQGWVLEGRPHLVKSHKVVVADVYDPMHLEQLEQAYDAPGERGRFDVVRKTTRVLNEQLERADFMLCASVKQRDLWIGALAGLGRVNPVTYDGDESLRHLLAVVPFGVGDEPPVQTRSAIRGTVPGIGPDDKVILWGGGVYNWFDPLTLVHAVDRLRASVPTCRLLFLGMKHPNPGVPQMRVAYETRRLAEDLGLVGSHVFFNAEWVDFDDRHNYLLDADVGVSTHFDHIETEFSFRTRILDYLWAELPIVATDGDGFADLIRSEGLGEVVPPRDVDALTAALERVLSEDGAAEGYRANIRRVAPELRWEACLEPLAEFCRRPRRAPDVCCPDLDRHASLAGLPRGRRRDIQVAMSYLRAGAPRVVVDRIRKRVRSRLT